MFRVSERDDAHALARIFDLFQHPFGRIGMNDVRQTQGVSDTG